VEGRREGGREGGRHKEKSLSKGQHTHSSKQGRREGRVAGRLHIRTDRQTGRVERQPGRQRQKKGRQNGNGRTASQSVLMGHLQIAEYVGRPTDRPTDRQTATPSLPSLVLPSPSLPLCPLSSIHPSVELAPPASGSFHPQPHHVHSAVCGLTRKQVLQNCCARLSPPSLSTLPSPRVP